MSCPFDFSFHQCIPATIHPGYAGLFHIFQICELLLELCTCCPFAWNTFTLPLSLHLNTYLSSEFSLPSWGRRNLEKQGIICQTPQHRSWLATTTFHMSFVKHVLYHLWWYKMHHFWKQLISHCDKFDFWTPERTRLKKYNSFSKV